jgi:hypothetical protein
VNSNETTFFEPNAYFLVEYFQGRILAGDTMRGARRTPKDIGTHSAVEHGIAENTCGEPY